MFFLCFLSNSYLALINAGVRNATNVNRMQKIAEPDDVENAEVVEEEFSESESEEDSFSLDEKVDQKSDD